MKMKMFQRKMINGSGPPLQQTLYQGCSEKPMSNSVKEYNFNNKEVVFKPLFDFVKIYW